MLPDLPPQPFSDSQVVAAYAIFLASDLVFALGKFPGMKIDRPGAAIIGAVLMVAFGMVRPEETLRFIDFSTIVLLFSMMLIVAYLHLAGFFDWITHLVVTRLHPHHLLPTVIFTSGVLSAFFVNDIICLVMVPFVLTATRRMRVKRLSYLLAVATASNIGSVASITGNPQNMLIGSDSATISVWDCRSPWRRSCSARSGCGSSIEPAPRWRSAEPRATNRVFVGSALQSFRLESLQRDFRSSSAGASQSTDHGRRGAARDPAIKES